MASSSEPVKTLEQVNTQLDQEEDTILAKGYKWGDRTADIEIQENWPGAPRLMSYTREQNSYGGTNVQLVHDANTLMSVPSRYDFTSDDPSHGGTNANKKKNDDGKSVKAVKLHEKKNADDKSLHALVTLSKRKYSAKTDKDTANYKCPNCPNLYFYATPLENNGQKRKHQRCGDKSQVLVPYHACTSCMH